MMYLIYLLSHKLLGYLMYFAQHNGQLSLFSQLLNSLVKVSCQQKSLSIDIPKHVKFWL